MLNERNEMETVTQELYNPHAFIAVRRINSETQENTFPLYKATDIETVLNRINLLEQRIEHQEKQIGQIIDNLTVDGWFSDSVDKEEVLRDLCVILDHEPKQTMNWTVTLTVSGSTEVDITEVNDFDIRAALKAAYWEAEFSGLDPYYISDNVFDLGTGSIEKVSALISKYKLDILVESDYEPTGYRR